MEDLSTKPVLVKGKPIASLADLQLYAYEVPEDQVPPAIITQLISGADVDPAELHRALLSSAREAVASSDAGLEVVETLRLGLEHEFPELAS